MVKKYMKKTKKSKNIKKTIPKGKKFHSDCYIHWCKNEINVFDFHVGHDKPESKGGTLAVSNLKPICARCNLSMSNNYSIQEWNNLQEQTKCCVIC